MAEAAEEVLPAVPGRRLLADGGYFQINDLAACEGRGWEVYVPPYPQRKSQAGKYPAGELLTRHADYRKNGVTSQTYYNSGACRGCPLKGRCTGGAYRKIHRHENQATVDRMRGRLAAEPGIYRNRAATVEHPFGSMMFWNEGKNLLCRGRVLANAELGLSALAYNLKRAVKVVGVRRLVEVIRGKRRRGGHQNATRGGRFGTAWWGGLKNWRSARRQTGPQNSFPALPVGA